MFNEDVNVLQQLGADITTKEIAQQPELWEDAFNIYENNLEAINEFVERAKALGGSEKTHVIFTGAGTSAYVGDTVVPYLFRCGDKAFEYEAKATTDIVSAPLDYLDPKCPVVLVSFARSGNSPESLAAVERAGQVVDNILYLNITCAPEGKLAVESKGRKDALTILIPRANDKGFAMTGSYTCMELISTLIFDTASIEDKEKWVKAASEMGREVIEGEDEILDILDCDFERITYLGSGSFGAMTREAQLKILELTAGKIATNYDTSMGYRHGPKSFVNENSIVFDFVSNDPYTRMYDIDILNEIATDDIALHTVAIMQEDDTDYDGEALVFEGYEELPEAYLVLPFVMIAQTIALNASVMVDNTPDTPSANGTVNRVVKGVTIHEFKY